MMRCLLHTAVFECDGRVRWPICCPNEGTVKDALTTEIRYLLPVVSSFTIKGCWRGVSAGCCCVVRGHTHIQGRAASWDSSGSSEISRPGLRFCESSGFRGDAQVRKFQST